MRIDKITVQNFRSYREAEAELAPGLNIASGLNGVGKSTLLDAIAVCLTGTARGSETGRDLADLRGPGGKKWDITLDITLDKGGSFKCRRREGEGPRSAAQTLVDQTLGVPGAVIRACLYSGELLRLDRKAAQKLVMDLVADDTLDLPEETMSLLRHNLHFLSGLVPDKLTLSDIENAYKAAYDERRTAGQALKQLGSPGPPKPPMALGEQWVNVSKAEIEMERPKIVAKLEQLEKQRQELVRKADRIETGPAEAQARMDALEEQRGPVRDELNRMMAAKAIRQEVEQLSTRLKKAQDEGADHAARRKEIEAKLSGTKGKLEALAGTMKEIEDLPEKCPTCAGKISKARRDKMLADVQSKVDAIAAENTALEDELASLPEPGEDPDPILRRLEELDRLEARREELQAKLGELDTAISKAGLDLTKMTNEAKGGSDELREKAAGIADYMEKGRGRLAAVDTYLGALTEFEKAQGAREKAEREHGELDRLCQILGPDGIRKELAGGGGVEAFQAGINKRLEPMGFELDLGPLLALEDDPHVNGRRARLLSDSEGVRFGLAFQIAVAQACGFGLIVVDNFDWLHRSIRWPAIEALRKSGLQALILGTVAGELDEFREIAANHNEAGGPARYFLIEETDHGSVINMPTAEAVRRAG